MSCTVVSVMRMHKLKRDFEWHEHIKLCHTRLYALAATLHKCALISNAIHCCMYVYIACAPWIYQEKVFQEFTRIACTTASTILFFSSLFVAVFFFGLLFVCFIFYLSHLLWWCFLHSVWKFHLAQLYVGNSCRMNRTLHMHTHTKYYGIFCSSPYLVVAKECCFSIVLNRCSYYDIDLWQREQRSRREIQF